MINIGADADFIDELSIKNLGLFAWGLFSHMIVLL